MFSTKIFIYKSKVQFLYCYLHPMHPVLPSHCLTAISTWGPKNMDGSGGLFSAWTRLETWILEIFPKYSISQALKIWLIKYVRKEIYCALCRCYCALIYVIHISSFSSFRTLVFPLSIAVCTLDSSYPVVILCILWTVGQVMHLQKSEQCRKQLMK